MTAGETSFAYAGLEAEVDADPAHAVADTGGASLKVNATGNDGNLYRFLDRAQFARDIYVFSFYVKGAGVWRATGEYPNGLVVLPTIAKDNDVFAFPENLLYGTASFRKYMQGYLPGLMREDGRLCGNGGLTLPTAEAEKADFDWVKVEIPFNPYGLPDGATGEDGSATYRDEQVTQICLMIRTTGVTGTLWFDDFKVYRAGTAEPEYRKSAKLAVDGASPALIAFGQAYTFPTATARGLGDSGDYDVDLDADIKVTLEHKRELSAGVEGWYVYPDHEKLAIGEAARTFTPDWHGYYRLRYEVTHRGETVTTYFNANVQDTLTAISVNSSGVAKEIRYGDELDLSALTVTKTMSYTGEQPVAEGWTVDLGGYTTTSAPGTYTVTVSYAETYGGIKSDSFAVTVTDYATAFRMKTPPTKLTYAYGEPFDKSGLTAEVTLAYGGPQTLVAAELEIAGYDAQTVGTQSVKARYGSMEGEAFSVTVEDALSAVVVDTKDVKKSYTVGEELDLSGLVVQKVMKSGARVTLTAQDYTVEYGGYTTAGPAGSYTLTVKVTEGSLEKSASFEVEVRAKADGGDKGGCGGAGTGAASLLALLAIVGAGLVKFR